MYICVRGCVWCGVVWCDVVWCGVVWCGVVSGVVSGVVWFGVVWCGVVCGPSMVCPDVENCQFRAAAGICVVTR